MGFDLDALDMEILLGTRELLNVRWPDMVNVYIDDAKTYIDGLKNGFENGDSDAVLFNAHSLKSSSHILGIMSVVAIAEVVENGIRDAMESGADIAHLESHFSLLDDAFQRAIPKLRATIECGSGE